MANPLQACESALAALGASDRCVAIEPRASESQPADLRLLFTDRAWLRSEDGARLLTALAEALPASQARITKSTLLLRLDDAYMREIERDMAAGAGAEHVDRGILAGRRFAVSFVGPNTNKALHVGHLRNIVVGDALASALGAAGATVRRNSLVGDIGRRVCEAMAGYREHRPGEGPEALGIPGDRFVEACSQSFIAADGGLSAASTEAAEPNAEEREPRGDLPDVLMRRWLSGSVEERRDWSRLRSWALAGHRRTLARLGVGIDSWSFESEAVPRTLDLVAEGLGRGLLERDGDGAIVRRTGRSEYATMVLLRGDGLPTEHARLLGAYDRILDELAPEDTFVELAGDEWEPPASALRELLAELRPGPRNEAHVRIFHGLVTRSGGKIGSRGGEAPWIDDLLDEVVECGGVAALAKEAGGAADRAALADLIVRGTFLCAPLAGPLRFDRARLLEACSTPGWTIARAWARALRAQRADPGLDPLPRTLLACSQQHSRSLRRAVEHLDPTGLATHLLELSRACLAGPSPGPAAAPALRRTLAALGFHLAPNMRLRPSASRA